MMHLDDDQLLQILSGEGDSRWESHLGDCAACRERLASWEALLAAGRELVREELDSGELHRLTVLFRELGPDAPGRSFVARFLEGTARLVPAGVRGMAATSFRELEAGPWRLRLQLRPGAAGAFDLYGQLGGEEERGVLGGRLVLTRPDGLSAMAAVDEFGEFHVPALPEGRWRLTWWIAGDRIDLEELVVSGDSGEEPVDG